MLDLAKNTFAVHNSTHDCIKFKQTTRNGILTNNIVVKNFDLFSIIPILSYYKSEFQKLLFMMKKCKVTIFPHKLFWG